MTATRRQFLQTASLAVAGLAGLNRSVRAIEPIVRGGKAKFKFSLAAYSYRALLSGPKKSLELEDFIADCARFGIEGTELTSYYFPKEITHEYLTHIKQECFVQGLDISGTAVGNDLCLPKGEKRDTQIELVKTWIDHADTLGAPVIRIFSGKAGKDQTVEQAHKLAVEGIEECCEYARDHGVYLALENHGGLTENVDDMLKLIRDVKSPWFGVNVDTGNFHSATAYDDLAKIAPYAVNVQIKVVMKPKNSAAEPADFKRLAKIMREAGYQGYIVLEFEEAGDPRTECPRYLSQLREAFVS